MIKIAPSILSADFGNLVAQIKEVEACKADLLHIDVMDGHFVPNITIGPPIIKDIRSKTKIPFDVHLMIENPERHINNFVAAGSDILTIHVESEYDIHQTIKNIKNKNVRAGLAVNPSTPLSELKPFLHELDMILVMSVNPGYPGQKFIPEVLPKIQEARRLLADRKLNIDIEVDGGINIETAPLVAKAGANILVAGSAIFNAKNKIAMNMKNLRLAISISK